MCNKILLIGPPSKDRLQLEGAFNTKAASLDCHVDLVVIDGVDSIVDLNIERVPAIIMNNNFDDPITLNTSETSLHQRLLEIKARKGCVCDKSCRAKEKRDKLREKTVVTVEK